MTGARLVHKHWGTPTCPRCHAVLSDDDLVSDDWAGVTCEEARPPCPRDTDGDGNCGAPSCPYCGDPRTRSPLVAVRVVLTESEYQALRSEGALTASGTVAEAIRDRSRLGALPLYRRGDPAMDEAEYARRRRLSR